MPIIAFLTAQVPSTGNASPLPVDGTLLQPYVVGAVVCLAIVAVVLLLARMRMRRPRRGSGLLSDNIFDAFFGEAQVGIAVIDEHGAIARTNSVFEQMTGYEQASLLGKLYVDLVFDPSDAAGRDRVVGALDRFGESHTLTICRKDGSFFRARFIVSPAPAALSRNQSVVFIEEVGPDRDRDREPIREDNDEAPSRRNSSAPTDATIHGAGQTTSEASQTTSNSFLAVLDDELLTPLTIISGYLELLDDSSDAGQREVVGAIKSGVAQLSDRLDALLSYARIQSEPVTLQEEPTELMGLAVEAIEVVREKDETATPIRLVGKVDEPLVVIDQRAFFEVIHELIANAVRFGEGRDVSVSISLHAGQAVLCVSNVGGGFSSTMQSTVFDSFFQVSSGPSRRHRGFGLGLAMVREQVQRLGGSIVVSSEEGAGATFMVRVPVSPAGANRFGAAA